MSFLKNNRLHKIDLLAMIANENCEHPIQALARLAMKSEREDDNALAFQCYKELAQYVAPKLKSVEIQTNNTDVKPITIIVPQELEERVATHRNTIPDIVDAEYEDNPSNVVSLKRKEEDLDF